MIQVYPVQPITVSSSALPANAAVEMAGQLQRCADLLERLLINQQAVAQLLTQLSQPQTDSPETLVADARQSFQ